jgi:hypothetical protein
MINYSGEVLKLTYKEETLYFKNFFNDSIGEIT